MVSRRSFETTGREFDLAKPTIRRMRTVNAVDLLVDLLRFTKHCNERVQG
jgi:hypothetical protein